MNKVLRFVFVLMFLTAAFIVTAAPTPMPEPEVWEWHGEDVTGEEIPMVKITSTPREWYQLRSNGLKLDGASRICHGFDDGRYGWTGEIFRLVEDAWVKLPTTVGWVPTEEGHYMACAMAPAAGTYALYGYWSMPEGYVKGKPNCYSIGYGPNMLGVPWNFDAYPPDAVFGPFEGTFSWFPNTEIKYSIVNADPQLTGDLTGAVNTDGEGDFTFAPSQWYYSGPAIIEGTFTIHIDLPICIYDWEISWGASD